MTARLSARKSASIIALGVDPHQSYKSGRFTMPAEVLRHLGLNWNEEVRLRIESLDAQQLLWAGTTKMQSGPEIDSAELVQHVGQGERIRVVASRP